MSNLAPALEPAGFDLEDVTVTRAGQRSVVRVIVDRDGGIDLDAVAEASRLTSDALDADPEAFSGPYVLEVTSPGVDRPLTLPRHWRRASRRLVAVDLVDGGTVTGRVVDADDEAVELTPGDPSAKGPAKKPAAPMRLPYAGIRRAVVLVEFNARDDADDHSDIDHTDTDHTDTVEDAR